VRGGAYNALQGNSSFSDMQGIADQIHALNLKVGIYHTPWVQSYAGYPGASAMYADGTWIKETGSNSGKVNNKTLPWAIGPYHFVENEVAQWAEWGIDYLKYDWNPIELPETMGWKLAWKQRAKCLQPVESAAFSSIGNSPHANAGGREDITGDWASMIGKGSAWTGGHTRDRVIGTIRT
jgi:alpha-galactosidase